MILGDERILEAVNNGDIIIEPFVRENVGSNSYDVTLSKHLAWYRDPVLDAKRDNEVIRQEIGDAGFTLVPNRLYLGTTFEYVGSKKYVPWLDGKSSAGRLGVSAHVTAGRGDVGFFNHWTMEIFVVQAVTVYAGMPIAQFSFFESTPVLVPYDRKPQAKYHGRDPLPRPSMMWKNFERKAQSATPGYLMLGVKHPFVGDGAGGIPLNRCSQRIGPDGDRCELSADSFVHSSSENISANTPHPFVKGRFGDGYCVQNVVHFEGDAGDYCKRGRDHVVHNMEQK